MTEIYDRFHAKAVTVKSGPFAGQQGQGAATADNKVEVAFLIDGRIHRVWFEADNLEVQR